MDFIFVRNILGLYREHGKEHGNYYGILGIVLKERSRFFQGSSLGQLLKASWRRDCPNSKAADLEFYSILGIGSEIVSEIHRWIHQDFFHLFSLAGTLQFDFRLIQLRARSPEPRIVTSAA